MKFDAIYKELDEIYRAKNADYGDSFTETMRIAGIVSAATRLYDKAHRLLTLSTNQAQVKDETIRDTLLDMANYAIMAIDEGDKNGY